MKTWRFSLILTALITGAVFGAPDPADSTLVLWLKADDLDATHNPGDPVNSWVDAGSYGTTFAPDPAWNESPHYAEVVINPPTVASAVKFDRTGDRTLPGGADRLWQTNNLAPSFDPLNMGAGQALTVIAVYANAGSGIFDDSMPIIAKRGGGSCVWW